MKSSDFIKIVILLSLSFFVMPSRVEQSIGADIPQFEAKLSSDEQKQTEQCIYLPNPIAEKEPQNCNNCEHLIIAACLVMLLLLYVAILNRQANEALHRSEERFRTIADYTYDWEYWISADGKFIYVSPSCERITGYSQDEFMNDSGLLGKIVHPDDKDLLGCYFNNTSDHGKNFSDFRIIAKSGEERWINHVCHPVYNDKGERIGRRASNRDITERKKTEEKLRESEEKYRAMYNNAPLAYQSLDEDGKFLDVNPMWLKTLGYDREEIIGRWFGDFLHPDFTEHFKINFPAFRQRGYVADVRFRMRRKDGAFIFVSFEGCAGYTPEGRFRQTYCTFKDITQEYESERALQESERRLKTLIGQSPLGIAIVGRSGNLTECNRSLEQILGYHCEELMKSDFADFTYPDDLPKEQELGRQLWSGETNHYAMEKRCIRKDGSLIWVNIVCSVIRDEHDAIEAGFAFVQDITDRKRAEEMLRDSQYRLNLALRSAGMGVWEWDISNNQRYFDERSCRILGVNPSTFTGTSDEFFNMVYPDDRETIRAMLKTAVENSVLYDPEYRVVLPDGSIRYVKAIGSLYRDDAGNPARISGIIWDITERKYAEAEKAKLESRLRQAQSMEAIGTLAGGIAHDFNNILFPIIGYTEMTLDAVPRESRAYKNLQEVLKATMRAKDLVSQILTFSRQKEQEKRIFKLHHIVKEALKLLRSTLPSTIRITQNIDPDCDPAEGDPTQIHQIVMNLCTNAYHAMQDKGGEMKVSLTEIELLPEDMTAYPDMMPGVYLKLSVSDTGSGIPESILGKIFDPFFTTKPTGQGTGLGLSVVHGIVKKMGGDIRVYSEVGIGTAFVVYIPAVRSVSSDSDPSVASNVLIPAGTEHILLVDDEEPILDMLGTMLGGLGYRISSRTSSVEALKVFENKSDDFDMVITDMTMPNMTGVQLARKLLAIRPDIPIILCTGFSQHISYEKAKHAGIRGYLMKPVIRSEMAKMIRKVLEEMRNEM